MSDLHELLNLPYIDTPIGRITQGTIVRVNDITFCVFKRISKIEHNVDINEIHIHGTIIYFHFFDDSFLILRHEEVIIDSNEDFDECEMVRP